ncbi:TEA/ATTS domain family-domain-containing protein [Syncephalastrum racemosum]|uniref:TEA/ATTS domain family-domain-containing protein n=1 Tax=Syncephalastrum racemosum TaxID=13706 RepID=A0A1X2HAI8_SYNRA|nr:TEA/ATTS domain family-domain-containing protein [Syncephalastrum racemosum]
MTAHHNRELFQDHHHRLRRSCNLSSSHMTSSKRMSDMYEAAQLRRTAKRDPSSKDSESVWPPDVENAFLEALETIPKLGRRKVLVKGKPCGRNELIADYILRKTNKRRSRKQVSSHIQVLKNTRKNDPYFMRLLHEDDLSADVSQSGKDSNSSQPVPDLAMLSTSDESSLESTPSPPPSSLPTTTDRHFSAKTIYSHTHHHYPHARPLSFSNPSAFMRPDHYYSIPEATKPVETQIAGPYPYGRQASNQHASPVSVLWPRYCSLHFDYKNSSYASRSSHVLALAQSYQVNGDCPTSLEAKIGLDLPHPRTLDNEDNYGFHSTLFLESHERRTIESTTHIYSFGKNVLASKEIQQALMLNENRYTYSFTLANEFFDAFVKGVIMLDNRGTEAALSNLKMVQVFRDMESHQDLLTVHYDLERGQGTIDYH